MKIKTTIYSLVLDGPGGIVSGAFTTERAALGCLIQNYTAGVTPSVLQALIEGGYYDALENLLQEQGDGLTSWQIEENHLEIEAPLLAQSLLALRRLLACPDLNLDSLESETAAAIAVAQAALTTATLAQS